MIILSPGFRNLKVSCKMKSWQLRNQLFLDLHVQYKVIKACLVGNLVIGCILLKQTWLTVCQIPPRPIGVFWVGWAAFFQFLIFPLWKLWNSSIQSLRTDQNLWKELKGVCWNSERSVCIISEVWRWEFAESLKDVFRKSNFNLLYRYYTANIIYEIVYTLSTLLKFKTFKCHSFTLQTIV